MSKKQETITVYSVHETNGVPSLHVVTWTNQNGVWTSSDYPGQAQTVTPKIPPCRLNPDSAIEEWRQYKLDMAAECQHTSNEWLKAAKRHRKLAKARVRRP